MKNIYKVYNIHDISFHAGEAESLIIPCDDKKQAAPLFSALAGLYCPEGGLVSWNGKKINCSGANIGICSDTSFFHSICKYTSLFSHGYNEKTVLSGCCYMMINHFLGACSVISCSNDFLLFEYILSMSLTADIIILCYPFIRENPQHNSVVSDVIRTITEQERKICLISSETNNIPACYSGKIYSGFI